MLDQNQIETIERARAGFVTVSTEGQLLGIDTDVIDAAALLARANRPQARSCGW